MKTTHPPEQLLLTEMQVLLAEKRTYLSLLRTGLTITTLPFTVIIFLVVTAPYHTIFRYTWLGGTLIVALLFVSASGVRIFFKARRKISYLDHLMKNIEHKNKRIAEIVI